MESSFLTKSSSGCSSDECESTPSQMHSKKKNVYNNSQCIVWTGSQLFYIGRDCQTLPETLGNNYGEQCTRLDLSFNVLRNEITNETNILKPLSSLRGLDKFSNLEELILDNNQMDDAIRFPHLPYLRTLSLNKNKIKDLESLLDKIVSYLPALRYLSLHGNPACPNQLSSFDNDDEDYQRYRLRVLFRLPKLNFLDSTPVRSAERAEASRVGAYTKVQRPTTTCCEGSNGDYDDHMYSPLPQTPAQEGVHRGAYGICRYKYLGLHSEGNRFIRNNDL